MTTTEALKKIKEMFLGEVAPVVAPIVAPVVAAATDYTLPDGTVVSIDKLEVGGMVMIAGVPAPDGDITLADGTVITVLAGVITEVKEVAPIETASELPAQMSADFTAHKEAFASEVKALRAELAKQKDTITEMFSLMETMAAQEVTKPLEVKQKTWDEMSTLEKRRANK